MAKLPRVVTCRGATRASQLAAEIARVLAAEGVTGPPLDLASADDPRGDGALVALDGCASACGSRAASARGLPLAARMTVRDLGVVDAPFETVDVVARARRVLSRAERTRRPTPLGRPRWGASWTASSAGEVHTADDYLAALELLTSPIVECGALVPNLPTLASHVSLALGVSRATAGEVLRKLEHDGLVRRGGGKELLLTETGRARADAVLRRQRLVEILLTSYLGYPLEACYEQARAVSRSLDEDAVSRLDRALGSPERCPHGWPISSERAREEARRLRALASLEPGARGRVVRLPETDSGALRLLSERGIGLGLGVAVESATAPDELALVASGRRLTVPEAAARGVLVEETGREP